MVSAMPMTGNADVQKALAERIVANPVRHSETIIAVVCKRPWPFVVCGSLADGQDRYPRAGEDCECAPGWSGINCNGEHQSVLIMEKDVL